jgi:hypothetical protein
MTIVTQLDRESGIWKKWVGERDALLKASLACWIPIGDLKSYLNTLPGPQLTATDVSHARGLIGKSPTPHTRMTI